MTDQDFERLGFSVGLKCKVKRALSERQKWLTCNSVSQFLDGVQLSTGKNFAEHKARLEQEDIHTVEDLLNMADGDYKELGFSIGLKCKVQRYLGERKALMHSIQFSTNDE